MEETGIFIGDSDSCDVKLNTIIEGILGLKVVSSSKVNISLNIINNCLNGLNLLKSRECYVQQNNFTKCGLSFEEVDKADIVTWIIEENFVNNKSLGFFKHKGTNFIVEGEFGQVILVACVRVTVQNIEIKDVSLGIGFFYCDNSVIRNCNVYNTHHNFVLYGSSACNITSSRSFNSVYGTLIYRSYDCSISSTECYENEYGIDIGLSEYCVIEDCDIYNNSHYGIQLHFSDYCEIVDSQLYNNTMSIYLNFVSTILIDNNEIFKNSPNPDSSYNSAGIYSTTAIEVTIKKNSLFENERGVFLLFSRYFSISDNCFRRNEIGIIGNEIIESEIMYNWFEENDNYAITLGSMSRGNIIHHNAFIDNNDGSVQVSDDGSNNTWFQIETGQGNYWNDYQKTGNYSIDGLANSYDLYPLQRNPLTKIYSGYYAFFSLLILIPFVIIFSKKTKKKLN